MYEQITREIKQDYYQHNFPNDGQRFLAWYLRNIHRRDMNEAKSDITDGPDDKQIDVVYIDDDGATIYIMQGKFIGANSVDAEPLREVLSSWAQLRDIVRLQENCNNYRLQQRLADIATALADDYEIVFELVTTAPLTSSAQNDLGVFQQTIANSDDLPAKLYLIDQEELKRRYDLALDRENPSLTHSLNLEPGRFLELEISGTKAVLAAIPLRDCLGFPGIKDGTLFQKNVRQSLGLSNPVNKGIRSTIYGDKHRDFFFFHNGITAICNRLTLNDRGQLSMHSLSVVNGCQSLNTILSCSERVKQIPDTYIMWRFYEIPQRDRADRISVYTNSQSAVKPRDLRSNDKYVLNLQRLFEQRYPQGYLITKRGEIAPPTTDRQFVIDLSELGKCLITWHSQRPNIAYSENKIFDKYFEQLFRRDYLPEDAQALHMWMTAVVNGWTAANPFNLNESLLAMRALAQYHHLYAVSMCFAQMSRLPEMVVSPSSAYSRATSTGQTDQVVLIAANCLNSALEAAANEPQPTSRVFSPQNWLKTKTCLSSINAAIRQYFSMLPTMPGGRELIGSLRDTLELSRDQFDYRWAAD